MFQSLKSAIEHRTGLGSMLRAMLYEPIPGGARWRYVWGSTLVFAFTVQLITGFCLWAFYSPSAQTAWESVYYIQNEVGGGALLRGLHHYTAQAMVVLLGLHMLQVLIDGAYRAPREFNFWIGLLLLLVVLGLGLTGYLLPWDQKGYWATKVATNLMGLAPVGADAIKRLVVGGSQYGHQTLTRFFALHAGLLPLALMALTAVHIYLFRRHGIHARSATRPDGTAEVGVFWPDQVLRDAVVCLAVFAVVTILAIWKPAPLMAPADPSEPFSAARPEWYFLCLFQLLKLFPGESTVWGAVYIPTAIVGYLFLMPLLGRWRIFHWLNIAVLFGLLGGSLALTAIAIARDGKNEEYIHAVRVAEADAERAHELASTLGIPPSGAISLLRSDPRTQGPKLFARHCASCHQHDGYDELSKAPSAAPSAPDLGGFGSRAWLTGLLDPTKVASPHYYGGTAHVDGKMVGFVKETVAEYSPEQKELLQKVIKAISAEAALASQKELDAADQAEIEQGRRLFGPRTDETPGLNCARCHVLGDVGREGKAPELTGWGSRAWILGILEDPTHEKYYGESNDRMPRFGADKILQPESLELLADWLRGEWVRAGAPTPAR